MQHSGKYAALDIDATRITRNTDHGAAGFLLHTRWVILTKTPLNSRDSLAAYFLKGFSMKKQARKRGPVPPQSGRVRVTVNLSRALVPFVQSQAGKSLSAKIEGIIDRMSSLVE